MTTPTQTTPLCDHQNWVPYDQRKGYTPPKDPFIEVRDACTVAAQRGHGVVEFTRPASRTHAAINGLTQG